MAKVKAFIRATRGKKKDSTRFGLSKPAPVLFRLTSGHVDLSHVSEIFVLVENWNANDQQVKKSKDLSEADQIAINSAITARKSLLLDIYSKLSATGTPPNSLQWRDAIAEALGAQIKADEMIKGFFPIYDRFILSKPEQRKHLEVLKRILKRWEKYRQLIEERRFTLELDTLTPGDIQLLDGYLATESETIEDFPQLMDEMDKRTRKPEPRGANARINILNRFRTFYFWAVEEGYTTNNPFIKYIVKQRRYGTPYSITIDERRAFLSVDLSEYPETETQRDIFVFQCLIGCRVSDLQKLTPANVKGEVLEYIARKTIEGHPETTTVALTPTAKALIKKYEGKDPKGRLFPFISDQKYNKQIKRAFKIAGLTRLVTVLNPTTGKEEQKPLNEIASSHLSRRSFIQGLFDNGVREEVIGKMTGHVEGSRAFARYRAIKKEHLAEAVKFLE